jgi:hypothetical protein
VVLLSKFTVLSVIQFCAWYSIYIMNKILRSSLITLASFIFVITALHAWTGPQVPPPDDNATAPITASATNQEKTGGLWLGSLAVTGKAISSSTVDSDPGNTLVTKDYLDARLAALSPAAPSVPTVTTWDSPGTYTYVVPAGVTSITVTGTGAGGGGFNKGSNPEGAWFYSGSGAGGVIDQTVSVTPGELLTVIVGAANGGSTYLRRGATDLIALGGGGNGGFSQPGGGTGPLAGQAGSYQACGMYPKPLSGANASAVGSSYGYGGYSGCDGSRGDGGSGYFSITD